MTRYEVALFSAHCLLLVLRIWKHCGLGVVFLGFSCSVKHPGEPGIPGPQSPCHILHLLCYIKAIYHYIFPDIILYSWISHLWIQPTTDQTVFKNHVETSCFLLFTKEYSITILDRIYAAFSILHNLEKIQIQGRMCGFYENMALFH